MLASRATVPVRVHAYDSKTPYKDQIIKSEALSAARYSIANCAGLSCLVATLLMHETLHAPNVSVEIMHGGPKEGHTVHDFVIVSINGKKIVIDCWAGVFGYLKDYPSFTDQMRYIEPYFRTSIGKYSADTLKLTKPAPQAETIPYANSESYDALRILKGYFHHMFPNTGASSYVFGMIRAKKLPAKYLHYIKNIPKNEAYSLLLNTYDAHAAHSHRRWFWLCHIILRQRNDIVRLLDDNDFTLTNTTDASICASQQARLAEILLPDMLVAAREHKVIVDTTGIEKLKQLEISSWAEAIAADADFHPEKFKETVELLKR